MTPEPPHPPGDVTPSLRGLPLAPPPDELVEHAIANAHKMGLKARFTTVVGPAGVLVWAIKLETGRGDLVRFPGCEGYSHRNRRWEPKDWLTVLHDLGLMHRPDAN